MTIKDCQEEYRKMWNWIADETERKQRFVTKQDYFKLEKKYDSWETPMNNCFACEYAQHLISKTSCPHMCYNCPIDWDTLRIGTEDGASSYEYYYNCQNEKSAYQEWRILTMRCSYTTEKENIRKAAQLAREIANLPFKDDVKE